MATLFGLGRKRFAEPEQPTLSMTDVLDRFDVEDVSVEPGHEYMIVVDKQDNARYNKQFAAKEKIPPQHISAEFAAASPSPWTAFRRREYLSELYGINGLRMYDKMRRSDATVRETLRLYKTPVLAARFFMEPGGVKDDGTISQVNINVNKFIWDNMVEWMSTSWPQTLVESCLMVDYGYYMFEKVFIEGTDTENRGKIIWKKMAPRHPLDVTEWLFDRTGGPVGVMMPDPNNMGSYVTVPISKLLVFSFDKEAGDITGMSVLRSAYKHWYYKEQLYKIDAIQKERHGIGIPVIKLPIGYSQEDKRIANDLGRNLRTNERAHVVLPPNWDLAFAELKGQPVDVIKSIEHHDSLIEKNVMGSFVSSTSATDENHDMFLKSARFIADIITETWNQYAIKQLVDYNWTNVEYPKLKARRIGEQSDWRTISFALRNLIGAGVIVPDDKLEDAAREMMDMPRRDPETARLVRGVLNRQEQQPPPTETGPTDAGGLAGKQEAVQQAQAAAGLQLPQVGTPRQSNTPPVGVPSPNAGRDGSGRR